MSNVLSKLLSMEIIDLKEDITKEKKNLCLFPDNTIRKQDYLSFNFIGLCGNS